MLALACYQPSQNLRSPSAGFAKTTRTRAPIRSSMEPPVSGFPYPPYRELVVAELMSAIEARVGPALLPSAVPPDVLRFENPQGTSQGTLDVRCGAHNSTVDFLLESWLHCKLPPDRALDITTIFAYLNASTDAPHLMMEFIRGGPTSLILFMDLLPRKDLVLHPGYLDQYYGSTQLDKLREDLEQLPQASPYRSSSLFIRSMLSPIAIAVSIDCGEGGESCMEEIMRDHIGRAAKEFVEVWLHRCAGKPEDLEETARAELVKRDGVIKSKTVEIDLSASLPRLFGPDVANKVLGEIQKAFRLR